MGEDNQAKHRQKTRNLKRQSAKRAPYERILIVCEGEKTEPLYIKEIQSEKRLSSANVQIFSSKFGTEPLQVVDYAEMLFFNGDLVKGIEPKKFERVVTVFDRDDHLTYHNALEKMRALNGAHKNDNEEVVYFQAIASVPCFELWLLLHFEDVLAPIHRNDVFRRLKTYLQHYDKGQGGHWAATKHNLAVAKLRAEIKAEFIDPRNGNEPYTGMHYLVDMLLHLKD